jgi:penicillin-binding protein 1A
VVLQRMLEQGSITDAEYEIAVASPITARVYDRELDVPAPFPAEWVRQQLVGRLPDLYSGGYEVFTTLDSRQQKAASEAVRHGLLAYDRRHGYRGPEANVVEDGELSEAAIQTALAEHPQRANLEPAVVISVTDENAIARLTGNREILLDLDAMRWARQFIDVDTRGPRVERVGDVLTVGDVIRVQDLGAEPQTASDTDDEETDDDAEIPAEDLAAESGAASADAGEPHRWELAQLPEIQGALVSLDPHDGAVRAMVGGFDFGMSQYNQALQAARQPGSGFKPFVYSAALANGITPASVFMDAPLVFQDQNLESEYRPDNDNNAYNGPTRLREALYKSINLVSMRVLLAIGASEVLDYVKNFGFDTSTFPRNTQLAIGGGTMAVTPIDMARAYAVIANGGYLVEPHAIRAVRDITGKVIYEPRYPVVCDEDCQEQQAATDLVDAEPGTLEELLGAPRAQAPAGPEPDADTDDAPTLELASELPLLPAPRVIDERNAYIMQNMLQDVIRKGTGRRARSLGRSDLAGKTGTTNDAADTWFNGFNMDLVATVWVGFPDHAPLGANAYGSNTPLPIWIEYMQTALAGVEEKVPPQPPGVVTMKIDPASGELAAAQRQDAIFELFLEEHTPRVAASSSSTGSKDPDQEEIKDVDIF